MVNLELGNFETYLSSGELKNGGERTNSPSLHLSTECPKKKKYKG